MPQPVRFRAPESSGLADLYGARAARRACGARARMLLSIVGMALGAALAAPAHAQQEVSGQIYIPGPGERTGGDAATQATMAAMMQARAGGAAGLPAPAAAPAAMPAGMISIPGPGERGGVQAEGGGASAPNVITIPGPGERSAATAGGGASAPNVITIPGPGERTAATAGGGASAPNVITIPGPGERSAARTAAAMPLPAQATAERLAQTAEASPAARLAPRPQPALQRVSFATAANRVAPVVVQPQAAPASAPATATATTATNTAAAQAALAAAAQPPVPAGQQDGESIRTAALAYLQQQSAGLPGRISITVAPVFPRGLAACASLEPFLPPGARMWGRTTVGVRCIGAKPWTLYVQARIAVEVTYYTAARPIAPGETLSVADLQPRDGDLASLPRTVITDRAQALGAISLARIAAGLPLRTDMLRSASSVVIGQTVKLVADGPNFSISTEGSVLNNAAPGQQVQVRTGGGQIVTGIVKDAGTVQVQI